MHEVARSNESGRVIALRTTDQLIGDVAMKLQRHDPAADV